MSVAAIPKFKDKPYSTAPELDHPGRRHPFVIVGAGPVGLALALDLAHKGHSVTVLAKYDFIAHGSKAICFSKQSLDIFDRLGVGEKMLAKGVNWNVGKLFWQDRKDPVFEFDLLPIKEQKNPAFINIQQYYVEDYLADALEAMSNVDIRWGHEVKGIEPDRGSARLSVTTRDGSYQLVTDYVLACDGSRSGIRQSMGLDFEGRVFEDNFLIADIKFRGADAQERPAERWFWFDPPFCPGGTALLHKQPDDVWRLDFQLGWDVDREASVEPENVEPFIRGMLGETVEFEREWYSVYTFQCRRMKNFVHGPIIFVGDSAHLVSPFGARGANGGLADAENIAWKLDLVVRGRASTDLLQSYDFERVMAADENILHSTRSTDFMTPKNAASRAFRDAVLELSGEYEFARPFINSGRLSQATPYHDSPLSTPDSDQWTRGPAPGMPCVDAPVEAKHEDAWLLSGLGNRFVVLQFGGATPRTELDVVRLPTRGLAAERFDAENGATYLVRPDQVVAARWKSVTSQALKTAVARASAQ